MSDMSDKLRLDKDAGAGGATPGPEALDKLKGTTVAFRLELLACFLSNS